MSGAPRQGRLAASGLTPLLDTLFLLLFALLALSETREVTPRDEDAEEVRVVLPSVEPAAEGEAAEAPRRRVTIAVDSQSRVSLEPGGVRVATPRELDAELARLLDGALPEEVAVDLAADGAARHAVTVELLQELRLRGFVDVSLLASADPSPDRPFGAPSAPTGEGAPR